MPSRLKEYETLLVTALKNNYTHVTIPDFYSLVKSNSIYNDKKYFIHRHDIDSDLATARKMFEIEQKQNIKTSYYFRLSTFDPILMNEINNSGCEVGYHYEELAQYCKNHKIKSKKEITPHFEELQNIFKQNIKLLESRLNFKIKTIASHGDFVNRKINMSNFEFLTEQFLQEQKIELECYNETLLKHFNIILSDVGYPIYYKPNNPFKCIQEGHKVIYLLTHPKHWRVAPWINTKDNIQRFIEGIKYAI